MRAPAHVAAVVVVAVLGCFAAAASAEPVLTPVAGDGHTGFSGDGGPGASAQLNSPKSVAVDRAGNVFIADTNNNRVRKVDTDGVITTFAGTGMQGFSGDGGPAAAAQLNGPYAVASDALGDVFIADWGNNRIRKVDAHGIITTFAGNGADNDPGGLDGAPATGVPFPGPSTLAVSPRSNDVYAGNAARVQRITQDGRAFTVTAVVPGAPQPTGPTPPARVSGGALSVDPAGDVYFEYNDVIWRVAPSGEMTAVAGSGDYGDSGDGGPASMAELELVEGTAVAPDGSLLLADTSASAVRKVAPDGIISRVTDHTQGPEFPLSVAFDPWGALYIAYIGGDRVMRLGGPRANASKVLALPARRTCTSRRAFAIHIRQQPGVFYRSASVTLQGRSVPVVVYTAKRRVTTTAVPATLLNVRRFRAFIDLRGRAKGAYTVKLKVTTSSGQTLTATRTYRTCSRTGRLTGSLPRL